MPREPSSAPPVRKNQAMMREKVMGAVHVRLFRDWQIGEHVHDLPHDAWGYNTALGSAGGRHLLPDPG